MLASQSICEHIKKYYPNTVGDPIFFWQIEEEWFQQIEGFANASLENSFSDTGDACHRDIVNTQQNVTPKPNEQKRNQYNLFADTFCKPPNIYVCLDDNSCKKLTPEEYNSLEKYFDI